MSHALHQAIQTVLDSIAFAGPFGPAQERSLIRTVQGVLPRFVPKGTRTIIICHTDDLADGVTAVLEIVLISGPKRVETLRFDVSHM
jgi:hypothetical protein